MRERLQTSETLVALDHRTANIGNDIKEVYEDSSFLDAQKRKDGRSTQQLTTLSTNKQLSNVVS